MNYQLETYKSRKIEFLKIFSKAGWQVKIYTITRAETFKSKSILENALQELPNFMAIADKSKLPIYKTAFLLVHEAREGVWMLFNWWTGGEMIETVVYFTDYQKPNIIRPSPHKNALVCVWELEVFAHERQAWIKHILSDTKNSKFNNYLKDILCTV